jgi:hypothetical protein
MATIAFPLGFAIVGAFVYAFAAHPKVQEMGRIVFFSGLFWLVSVLATKQLHF